MKSDSPQQFIEILHKKIDGIFEENIRQHQLLDSIYRQTTLLCTQSTDKTLSRKTIFENNCRRFGITNKEKEIIVLMRQGYTQKEIAKKLFISGSTVNTHIRNIYSKVEAHNNVQMLDKIYTSENTMM